MNIRYASSPISPISSIINPPSSRPTPSHPVPLRPNVVAHAVARVVAVVSVSVSPFLGRVYCYRSLIEISVGIGLDSVVIDRAPPPSPPAPPPPPETHQ